METWSNMGILGWGLFLIHKVNLNVINEVNYNLFDFYFHRNHKFSRLWYLDRDCGYTYLLKTATYELPICPKGYIHKELQTYSNRIYSYVSCPSQALMEL